MLACGVIGSAALAPATVAMRTPAVARASVQMETVSDLKSLAKQLNPVMLPSERSIALRNLSPLT